MFGGATAFNQNISGWNTARVTRRKECFLRHGLQSGHLRLEYSNVTDMSYMFCGPSTQPECRPLGYLPRHRYELHVPG